MPPGNQWGDLRKLPAASGAAFAITDDSTGYILYQFKQMTVLHLLDAVGENYKPAIDFIQFAAFKLVPKLFASQR